MALDGFLVLGISGRVEGDTGWILGTSGTGEGGTGGVLGFRDPGAVQDGTGWV